MGLTHEIAIIEIVGNLDKQCFLGCYAAGI